MGKTAEEASKSPDSDGERVSSDHCNGVEGYTAGMSLLPCFMHLCLRQTIASESMNSVERYIAALQSSAGDELSDPIMKRVCECAACTPLLQVFLSN
jgi:hypothetical protein